MKQCMMIALAAILATAVTVSPAHAIPLAPGGAVTAPNAAFGPVAYPAGGTVLASVTNEVPFSAVGVTGTLTTEAIRNAGGSVDFLYQFTAAAGNLSAIHRITATDFTGYSTDVRFGTGPAPFVAPTALFMAGADRSAVTGDAIGWQIAPAGSAGGVSAGQKSYVLIVKTNATSFKAGSTFAIDGGVISFSSYAPSGPTITAVPEPSTMAIAGLGALGFIGYGLRRRKALGA